MRCGIVSPVVSDTFSVACNDVFLTTTILFEVFMVFGILMVALEILQKCEYI